MANLVNFVEESNKIESIVGITKEETEELDRFINLKTVTCFDLCQFVEIYASAVLRDKLGLNVRVGQHVAPPGGPEIKVRLELLLHLLPHMSPFELHKLYENLHPFTDGNGRSGRALWLWRMRNIGQLYQALNLGFLHIWYYQSLSEGR